MTMATAAAPTFTTSAPAVADHMVSGSAASCARLTPAQQFRAARVVFVGTMLLGPTVPAGGGRVELSSPARMRVSHYLKGRGPSVVRVQTAVKQSGRGYRFSEDGIEASAGDRWKIYVSSQRQPYSTSICGGSKRVSGARRSTLLGQLTTVAPAGR
jgi:hypothetical protein